MRMDKNEIARGIHDELCLHHMGLAFATRTATIIQISDADMAKDVIYIGARANWQLYMLYTDIEQKKMFLVKKMREGMDMDTEIYQLQNMDDYENYQFMELRDRIHSKIMLWASGGIDKIEW